MQTQVGIALAVAFVATCWLLVVGHQLEWGVLSDPDQYSVLRASMFIAYTVAAVSVCALFLGILALFRKEQPN